MLNNTYINPFCNKAEIIHNYLAENPLYLYDFRLYVFLMLLFSFLIINEGRIINRFDKYGKHIIEISKGSIFVLSLALFLFLLLPNLVLKL